MRFILAVISGELNIRNVKKADIIEELVSEGYAPFPKKKAVTKKADDDSDDDEEEEEQGTQAGDYDYLLSMKLWSLTKEKVDAMRAQKAEKEAELNTLLATSAEDMWRADLDTFEVALDEHEKQEAKIAQADSKARKGGRKKQSSYSDYSDDDWDAPKKKKAAKKKGGSSTATLDASRTGELIPVPERDLKAVVDRDLSLEAVTKSLESTALSNSVSDMSLMDKLAAKREKAAATAAKKAARKEAASKPKAAKVWPPLDASALDIISVYFSR